MQLESPQKTKVRLKREIRSSCLQSTLSPFSSLLFSSTRQEHPRFYPTNNFRMTLLPHQASLNTLIKLKMLAFDTESLWSLSPLVLSDLRWVYLYYRRGRFHVFQRNHLDNQKTRFQRESLMN